MIINIIIFKQQPQPWQETSKNKNVKIISNWEKKIAAKDLTNERNNFYYENSPSFEDTWKGAMANNRS